MHALTASHGLATSDLLSILPSLSLREYQAAEVMRMVGIERTEYSPRPGISIRTRFGVFGTKVGSGKTVSLCALIRHTADEDPLDLVQPDVVIGSVGMVVRRTMPQPQGITHTRCSLIVCPHGLRYQWQHELDRLGISTCSPDNLDPGKEACLVPATRLAELHRHHPLVHWKRLILDEADSIVIRSQPALSASFTWFVTASYTALGSSAHLSPCRPLFSRCFRHFDALGLTVEDVTVRASNEWVDACNQLPAIQARTVVCAMPAYMQAMLGSGLSASVAEMLAAGDVKAAILAMGGDTESEHDIVTVVLGRLERDIARLEARATYMTSIGHQGGAQSALDAISSKQHQCDGIRQRLSQFKEDTCAICMNGLADTDSSPVVTKCCSHVFCANCIVRWRCRVNSCPMCRARDFGFTLIRCVAQEGSPPPASLNHQLTKEDELLRIIDSRPDGRFIVFSNWDGTFNTLQDLLHRHHVSCRVLKGTPAAFRKILTDHEHGRTRVLLMNSRFDGAGHNMQWVTDAITFHKLHPTTEAQVIGRGMRPGRTQPLTVHHLRWECEADP